MSIVFTVIAGIALAGVATFGVVSSQSNIPAGPPLPPDGITYDIGQ